MAVTTQQDVFNSFEASFQDKSVIPVSLEREWLLKAIGRYSIEIEQIDYSLNSEDSSIVFTKDLGRYVIDTLGAFMKQSYQERELSKVNKRVNITGKDLSVGAGGHVYVAAREELEYDRAKSAQMVQFQKPTAYK